MQRLRYRAKTVPHRSALNRSSRAMKIVIGSRGSALAIWQARWVQERLAATGNEVEIRVIHTSGDRKSQVSLEDSGVKGLFIKEIEEAILDSSINLAVHSLKDLPTDLPGGLALAAVPTREDARDVLVSRNDEAFAALPRGSRIGTSSVRRQAQLRSLRPDLNMVSMRGNVETRLRKLERGDCDAVVLAAAGIIRLGLKSKITAYFPVDELCPAVGQGALAIETRAADAEINAIVAALDDADAHAAVRAERAVLRCLGGGCSLPIAAHATESHGTLSLLGIVARPDGRRVIRASKSGQPCRPEELGLAAAEDLLRQGARELLEAS